MKPEERMCCLTLDEMSIKKAIEFDPSLGTIVGHANLPGSQGIANSAYVFMLGGNCMPHMLYDAAVFAVLAVAVLATLHCSEDSVAC